MVQAAAGKDIWIVGGGDLAGQFADIGALDEIVLTIASASLASGAPVLPRRLGSDRLTLHNVHRQGQFVELRYVLGPLPAPTTGATASDPQDPHNQQG